MNIIFVSGGSANFLTPEANERRFWPITSSELDRHIDESISQAANQRPNGASLVELADAAGLTRTPQDLRRAAKHATALGLVKVRVRTPVPRFVWKKA